MMVPVRQIDGDEIVPREQYMAAMTFVTLPGQVGPLLGQRSAVCWWWSTRRGTGSF